MATKTAKYPKLGTAKLSRVCPACEELIHTGEPIAWQGSLFAWVHPGCFLDPRLKRLDDQLKDTFFATVC